MDQYTVILRLKVNAFTPTDAEDQARAIANQVQADSSRVVVSGVDDLFAPNGERI